MVYRHEEGAAASPAFALSRSNEREDAGRLKDFSFSTPYPAQGCLGPPVTTRVQAVSDLRLYSASEKLQSVSLFQ